MENKIEELPIEVKPLEGYLLYIKFKNNEEKIYDMKESYGIDLSQIDVDKFNISNFGLKNKKNKKNMFSKKNKSKFSNFNNSDRLLFNKK